MRTTIPGSRNYSQNNIEYVRQLNTAQGERRREFAEMLFGGFVCENKNASGCQKSREKVERRIQMHNL